MKTFSFIICVEFSVINRITLEHTLENSQRTAPIVVMSLAQAYGAVVDVKRTMSQDARFAPITSWIDCYLSLCINIYLDNHFPGKQTIKEKKIHFS